MFFSYMPSWDISMRVYALWLKSECVIYNSCNLNSFCILFGCK